LVRGSGMTYAGMTYPDAWHASFRVTCMALRCVCVSVYFLRVCVCVSLSLSLSLSLRYINKCFYFTHVWRSNVNIWTSRVAHLNESCRTYAWVVSQSHYIHWSHLLLHVWSNLNESCRTGALYMSGFVTRRELILTRKLHLGHSDVRHHSLILGDWSCISMTCHNLFRFVTRREFASAKLHLEHRLGESKFSNI